MKAGGNKTAFIGAHCDIQNTSQKQEQCRTNFQAYYDLACGSNLFKAQCEEVVEDNIFASLGQTCQADSSNDNAIKLAQCVYLNLDEGYKYKKGNKKGEDARKKFVVERWKNEGALFASDHLARIKPAVFAQAEPGVVFGAVEGAITDPVAKANLKSLIQLCNSATGKEEGAKKILATALTTLSGDIPALTAALKNMTAPFDTAKKQIEQLTGVVSFSNPVATENAGILSKLCEQLIIADPENKECKLSVQRGQKQIAAQAGAKAEAVYTNPSSSPVTLRLKLKVDDPRNQDTTDAIEEPKATLEEFQQAMVMEYGHAPRLKFWTGYILAPNGGYGEAKDGQNFEYDNLNGHLSAGYPFLRFGGGVTFGHTLDSFNMLSLELDWARGEPVQDANTAEGEIDTGDNIILGLGFSKHNFFRPDTDWYLKGALRLHYVSDIPRGPNLGPGGILQPGVYLGAGLEYYLSRQTSLFVEGAFSWSYDKDNLLSETDLAADPNLVDRELFNMYRTQGGTPIVPSLTIGVRH